MISRNIVYVYLFVYLFMFTCLRIYVLVGEAVRYSYVIIMSWFTGNITVAFCQALTF